METLDSQTWSKSLEKAREALRLLGRMECVLWAGGEPLKGFKE